MGRVARSLIVAEVIERLRDRWVLVVSVLFALLAAGVSLYGRKVEGAAVDLTGASLVTLASLLVPLVALVLGHDAIVGERERNTLGLLLSLPISRLEVVIAKYVGRLLALTVAIGAGLGVSIAIAPPGGRLALLYLLGPSLTLGAAFLAIGVLVSSVTRRQITAASAVVAIWFFLVILYDLGLLGLLVVTDGAIGQQTVAYLVLANPVGLFRLQMLSVFGGAGGLESLGMAIPSARSLGTALSWLAWVVVPVGLSGLFLTLRRSDR